MLRGYYNGVEFSRYCTINDIYPSLSAPIETEFHTNPFVNGGRFYRSKLGQIVLEVDITLTGDIYHNLEMLNRIFYTKEPKALWFDNRPDRYLMCMVTGEVKLSSSYALGRAKIVFISPHSYWKSKQGYSTVPFVGGTVTVNNRGSAPTKPLYDIKFNSDCGYLNVIGPNGFLALGNPHQEDTITLPSSEIALQDNFTSNSLSSWKREQNAAALIPDYNKMSSALTGEINGVGLTLTRPGARQNFWNGHAISKNFTAGVVGHTADNFDLSAKVAMSNTEGVNNTCAMLIVVMDEANTPIMTTSVYDINSGKNELTVTFKVPEDSGSKRSKIIHSGKLATLDGRIRMIKKGNRFTWEVYSDKTVVTTGQALRIGMQAHIKKTSTRAETGHPIKQGYHDLTYTIGAVKTGADGTKAYRMDHGGWAIYWIYERDIEESETTSISRMPSMVRHTLVDNQLAQLQAIKVFIWQASWDSTPPYSQFVVDNITVRRTHDVGEMDIRNIFTQGDHLYIDTESGEVMLNGANASGLLDYDSSFFALEGGATQLVLEHSKWATPPEVTITYESRWLS